MGKVELNFVCLFAQNSCSEDLLVMRHCKACKRGELIASMIIIRDEIGS